MGVFNLGTVTVALLWVAYCCGSLHGRTGEAAEKLEYSDVQAARECLSSLALSACILVSAHAASTGDLGTELAPGWVVLGVWFCFLLCPCLRQGWAAAFKALGTGAGEREPGGRGPQTEGENTGCPRAEQSHCQRSPNRNA